jgi:hypothetical protein
MYQVFDNALSAAEEKYVDALISDMGVSWYFRATTAKGKGAPNDNQVLVHTLLERPEVKTDQRVRSHLFEFFEGLFKNFCQRNKVQFKTIHRAALNLTFYNPQKFGFVHNDHRFAHKNFILYLNEFTGGSTYIMEDEKKILAEIEAKKNRAVVFDGCMHAQGFCALNESRVVFVLTFS